MHDIDIIDTTFTAVGNRRWSCARYLQKGCNAFFCWRCCDYNTVCHLDSPTIRLEAKLQPNIGFTFGGVHAFDYNTAESEPIWTKFGML